MPQDPGLQPSESPLRAHTPELRRYLIVDDNFAFANNLAEILSEAGAEVDVATSGEDALQRAAKMRYDALLSDMRMPVMGGAELVHRMRALDPGLPAVVLSAYTNDQDLRAVRREGPLAVFAKPAPLRSLIELLATARRDGMVVIDDDDEDLLDALEAVLRGRGFAAVRASTVLETEQLEEVAPFAALVDLRVPGGVDGAAMSRLLGRFPGLPMIVVSAQAAQAPPEAFAARFDKPFDTGALLWAIERLYDERLARS